MGKKKETFFERLTKKNAQQQENQNPRVRKTKNWKFWLISSLLVGALSAGITIPLVANTVVKNYIEPIKGDTDLFKYVRPDGSEVQFQMKDLKSSELVKDAKDPKKVLEQAYKHAVFYLYEQEVKASKEYQRLWNASRKDNDKERNDIALKSVDELRKKHRDLIKDVKELMIKQHGYSKWEQAFNDFLIKSFNGAKNIEEAVDFRVYSEIQRDALRRFTLNTTFNINDADRTATSTIYKLDANGQQTNEVLFQKGEKVFPFFQQDKNFFELQDIKQKMTFMTNSYVISTSNPKEYNEAYKGADSFIKHYLAHNNPVLFSQFSLPGIAPTKKENGKEAKWNFNKEAVKKLMFYWPIEKEAKIEAIPSFNKIKDTFKSYEEYNKIAISTPGSTLAKEIVDYSTVLATLSLDDADIKSNWGSAGLTSVSDLFKAGGDNTLKAFAKHKDILIKDSSSSLKEVDLFGELEKIRQNIIKTFNLTDVKNSLTGKNQAEAQTAIGDFNKALKKVFDDASDVKKEGLWSDKFNELVAKPLTQLFETDGKINTVYKLKDSQDTLIVLSSKGITLLKVNDLNSFAKNNSDNSHEAIIKEMIRNDFLISNKYQAANGKKYNALNQVNKSLSTPENVLNVLLKEQSFKNYLKNQNNIYALDNNGKLAPKTKYNDKDLAEIIEMNNSILNSFEIKSAYDLTKAVDKWMKDRAEGKYDSFFETKENKVYFAHNNDSYKKDAGHIIFEALKQARKAN
ncbi:hypothetical protein MCAL160_0977 [Mycoplasmopsis californica HAZ160_1]|uniref:Membrane protein P80 n=1 Tax=Mycoplasmopsis californica HAZ160_1 TaxID=1397850 RepID=A0AAT9F8T4_9BACT|nr:hypothetical protein [Mycoplasmopsis californica]BAP01302.1 hypothetical protein MCAL160_0977 [Mycoplasmopsis californica HAZ160_1]BBG41176.1 hypothetical protein MCAL106_0977 [Mycoplasmopsis californica]BBG41769.1 hypothetical protein MCAL106E_0977 [Mycoplasmopsis californica]BBG42363.1 hypothetical protein MCAL106L_0977 [Mycoplasmopsis californica]BBG42938.1 hypothetical protein MCAL160E_0977 [Mycoplasmopsis californica]